ncbi:YbgC/FadM family acyl-CoA thioesterase [Nitratiruptor sp. YY09-18]|uniref:YbgC/FadM family acyl-CoA thioesterase n=1 Tax=Nitratiruptor sp. YY09-18 TaxID=2724901 RepID=UPI001915341B|nr:YbgC/FadM family acyl-CoA thioesterase [Nitratiruptor sp. YY09-18]
MKIRIYYEDVDIGGRVYHAKYLHFCERARSEMFFAQNLQPIFKEYHFIVKELQAHYIKPAFFGDLLEVRSKVVELKRASLYMLQEIYKEDELIFAMQIKLVCLKGEKPTKIPDYFLEAFGNQKDCIL